MNQISITCDCEVEECDHIPRAVEKMYVKYSQHPKSHEHKLISYKPDINIDTNATHTTHTTQMVGGQKLILRAVSSDGNKTYDVCITPNDGGESLHFTCTCGLQFGLPLRTNCVHIGRAILDLYNSVKKNE